MFVLGLHLTPPEFTDDEGLIAKGSSVIVRRIPVVGARSSSNAKIRNMYVCSCSSHTLLSCPPAPAIHPCADTVCNHPSNPEILLSFCLLFIDIYTIKQLSEFLTEPQWGHSQRLSRYYSGSVVASELTGANRRSCDGLNGLICRTTVLHLHTLSLHLNRHHFHSFKPFLQPSEISNMDIMDFCLFNYSEPHQYSKTLTYH